MGRAIAAPQIGYLKRVIFVNAERNLSLINPRIIYKSGEIVEVRDTCYSFQLAFFVKIKRHKRIRVEYFDERGISLSRTLKTNFLNFFNMRLII